MIKKLYLLCIALCVAVFTMAQSVELSALSFEDALRYAETHSASHLQQQLALSEAKTKAEEAQLQHIPNIYASGDFRRNLIIGATPVPAHIFNPNASEDELMYLKFNTKWNATMGINMTYDLFSPDKINSISESKRQQQLAEYDVALSAGDLRTQVAKAYSDCVIAMEQVSLLSADTTYYSELLRVANEQFDKQKIALTDRNNAAEAYNNALATLQQAQTIASQAKASLLHTIGYDVTVENINLLIPTDSVDNLINSLTPQSSIAFSEQSTALNKQQAMVQQASDRINLAMLKYAPTLTLNGYYGTNYYNNSLDLFNKDIWRGNSYIGLSLRVPITQALSTRKEVSRLRLQHQMQTQSLRDLQNKRQLDYLTQSYTLSTLNTTYTVKAENMQLATENHQAVKAQFAKGYAQASDVMASQTKLQQARQQFLEAAYNMFSTLIALEQINR